MIPFLLLAAAATCFGPSVANPAVGVLFPDCPALAEPGPQPLQYSRLTLPAGYEPGRTYEVDLYVIPHHGLESRFNLTVDEGTLSSADSAVRVTNSTTLGSADPATGSPGPFIGGRPDWKFNWTAPPTGSGKATFTLTTMSGYGDGVMGRDAWLTRRVPVPEGAPATPAPSPGFGAVAALAALASAGLWAARPRRR